MTNTIRKSDESKPSDRRVMKPVIEKRRRERINSSLRELKIILEAVLHGQIPRDSKMEKADILELTVNHLRLGQRRHFQTALNYDPTAMDKYRTGFSECASEISRFLTAANGVSDELKGRILNHLSNHVSTMRPVQNFNNSIRTPPTVDGYWHTAAPQSRIVTSGLTNYRQFEPVIGLRNRADNTNTNSNGLRHSPKLAVPPTIVKKELAKDLTSDDKQNIIVQKVPALRLRPSNENNIPSTQSVDSAFKPIKPEPQECHEIVTDNLNIVMPEYVSMWRPW